jgi:uncharacterized protein
MPPRLLPDVPLPPYGFVPGLSPHPVSDPAGHSFGRHDDLPHESLFARGVDLFNHGYYWEAHEAWETLWHAAGRTGPTADLLKGLIRLAACGVKARERRPAGVASHAAGAAALFRRAAEAQPDHILGLDPVELERLARSVMVAESPEVEPPVRVVFGFVLRPVS